MVAVYAPDGATETGRLELNPLPLAGPRLRIGILHNNKPNAELLLTTVAHELAAHLGAPEPVYAAKERASLPAPQDVINDLAVRTDLVLVGTAD